MPNLMDQLRGAQMPQPQFQQLQVLSPDQKAELEKVRGMQVRDRAAAIAADCLQGCSPTPQAFVMLAKVVEDYIRG